MTQLGNDVRILTGADLVEAMQTCPDGEVDFEPERFPMPVRRPRMQGK